MEAVLKAIAEPRRRAILRLVCDTELPAGGIAAHFDVSRPAVSQHLTVLKEAGLVSERRDGTRRLYRARPEGLAEVRAFLDEF
jgi:DNA-binding transcriptional ArsR family regulator